MNPNKTVKELTDIELATSLRDHLIESQRIQGNIQLLNQELELRQKDSLDGKTEQATKLKK